MTLIAITPWRRTLPTGVHPRSDLYTLNPDYVNEVERAGGRAVIVPHVEDDAAAREVLDRVDGLILSGGGDIDPSFYGAENTASFRPDPAADTSDLLLARAALARPTPLLAICRGAQILNVALGGTMHQHIWDQSADHPSKPSTDDPIADADFLLAHRHEVTLTADSTVAALFGSTSIRTNSLHHQSVHACGEGLRITGRAPDGIVEVVEHESAPAIGVQWHPERLADEGHGVLFDWLIKQSR